MATSKKRIETFDPVKEDKDGVKAKRVIWSSKALELAFEGLKQGRKLVANPFYENNTKLLKGDLVFDRTEEEIAEWLRCKNDIIYFVEKYCQLMTPEGIQHVKLRDYQKNYLKHLMDNRLSIYLACRQCGKCVSLLSKVKVKINLDAFNDIGDKLKQRLVKNYYDNTNNYFDIPLYEIMNLFNKSFTWKLKYSLYKVLHKLHNYEQEKNK